MVEKMQIQLDITKLLDFNLVLSRCISTGYDLYLTLNTISYYGNLQVLQMEGDTLGALQQIGLPAPDVYAVQNLLLVYFISCAT